MIKNDCDCDNDLGSDCGNQMRLPMCVYPYTFELNLTSKIYVLLCTLKLRKPSPLKTIPTTRCRASQSHGSRVLEPFAAPCSRSIPLRLPVHILSYHFFFFRLSFLSFPRPPSKCLSLTLSQLSISAPCLPL